MVLRCKVCGKYFKSITNSHLHLHAITQKEYKNLFPHSKIVKNDTIAKRNVSRQWYSHSKETKKKLSNAHKGKKLSEETKRKISLVQKGKKLTIEHRKKIKKHYMLHGSWHTGKKRSEETKKKISKASMGRIPWNKGNPCPKNVREKISRKLRGRSLSLETKRKMSFAQKGRVVKKSTRKKISEAKKGIRPSDTHIKKIIESMQKSPNKFEKKCIKLFKEHKLPLKFVGDYNNPNFFIAGKVPDFVSTNDKKVLVEVFYDYFKIRQYGSVDAYKKERSHLFNKHGWKTLFFEFKEIESDFEGCLSAIKKEVE